MACENTGCNECNFVASGFRIPKIQNPIADEIRPQQFFDTSIFIPYASTSQDVAIAYLFFLHKLAKVSPTKEACINFIIDTAFNDVEIVSIENVLGIKNESPISDSERTEFIEIIRDNINMPCTIQELAKKMCYTYLVDGNMATIEKIVIDDERAYGYIDFAHTYDYVFLKQIDGHLAYSKEFHSVSSQARLEELARKGSIYILPYNSEYRLYDDIMARMSHTKAGTNQFWGRPIGEASIYDQYGEYQNRAYQTTAAKYGFTLKHIIEKAGLTEAQEKELNKLLNERAINDNGDATYQSTLVMGKALDAPDMKIHDIEPFTDHQYFKETSEKFRQNIIISHKLSERLLGLSTANGFSSNVFLDEFDIKNVTVIKPIQNMVERHLNHAIKTMLEAMEIDVGNYYIKFKDAFDGINTDRGQG